MNLKATVRKTKLKRFFAAFEFAVDILCPKKCIVCNGFTDIASKLCLCSECRRITSKFGRVSVDDRAAYEEIISALEYDNCIRDAMMRYKFDGKRYLHRTFAWAIYKKISDRKFLSEIDIICPVPIHPLRVRDYNQSALIAQDIAEWTGIECIDDLLLKTKNLKPLSTMTYTNRRLFIRGSKNFNLKYDISGKNILIVDDIFTSGATIAECSRILKIYGAEKVYAVSACYAKCEEAVAEENDNEGGTANAYANIFTD